MEKDKTRAELAIELKRLREAGYRYIVRDDASSYVKVFSVKPIKSRSMEDVWEYQSTNAPGVLVIKNIKCEAAKEIKWENPKPTDITEWLKVYGR